MIGIQNKYRDKPEKLRIEFEKTLDLLGLEMNDLKPLVEDLYLKRISSKLMDKEPYLVILDRHKFMDILIWHLQEIEEEILALDK
ncbi:hypothetical protein QPL79_07450 [Ignisphaera sp. 4213-co]|uniref:Uncharacterized protein n=1 Tax=Ignisphaera cupida TaxID=3050454 RepID=A0ABD4Z793_9CREN|nr:hypothetical protein [Ignisphaera sp. 4213-co]MDK6029196.1 hypothetical protein [Ignisphaera sp. 4213-co]